MSYRSLGSDEVTLRNYRPVGRRKGNMSLSDPLAAGVVVDLHKPGLSGIRIRLPRRRLIKKKLVETCRFSPHERQRAPVPVRLLAVASSLKAGILLSLGYGCGLGF